MFNFYMKTLKDDEIELVIVRTADENKKKGYVPAYYFDIVKDDITIGCIDCRIGYNESTYYGGNVGYTIKEAYRGHGFATKAVLLLKELAKKHKMTHLIITCNPDNIASKRTCEKAGAVFVEKAELPKDNDMAISGETEKLIFKLMV
ncbi:MAG: GNAT family N-acetyltransferase [Clostridiales bacterium]|nr:GNAT family N-acetyltransferase [Clostridiales bacterium]